MALPAMVSLYPAGVLVGYFLCFKFGLEIEGLLYGSMNGFVILAFWLSYLLFIKWDWAHIAQEVKERQEKDQIQKEEKEPLL